MKPAAIDCPSFMWASAYVVTTTLILLVTRGQAPMWSVLVGAFVGALALEISVFKGGECMWLPSFLPTKALFHLLAVILGFVVILPAFAAFARGGTFLLFPAALALSLSAFFLIHLREHSGPPRSEQPAPLALHILAALPFYLLAAFGLVLAVFVVWSAVRQVHQ